VAEGVFVRSRCYQDLAGPVEGNDDAAIGVHLPLEVGVAGLDPAVHDRDASPFPARATPCPVRREIVERKRSREAQDS
jgi:hypothetical protein